MGNNTKQINNDSYTGYNGNNFIGYDLEEEKKLISEIEKDIKKDLLLRWKKSYANAQIFPSNITGINKNTLDFLLSFNLVAVYDDISKSVGLDENGRNILPHIIWQTVQDKNWNGILQILKSKLNIDENKAIKIYNLLDKYIISKINILEKKPIIEKNTTSREEKPNGIRIVFSEALLKYPKIGEQSITMNNLKLKYFPTPVRPSIKNWMTDYHDNMGAGKHSPIDRGNYLFHSENGKRLTSGERQKLSLFLKALDEGSEILINPIEQKIIFEQIEKNEIPKIIKPVQKEETYIVENNEKVENYFKTQSQNKANFFVPKTSESPIEKISENLEKQKVVEDFQHKEEKKEIVENEESKDVFDRFIFKGFGRNKIADDKEKNSQEKSVSQSPNFVSTLKRDDYFQKNQQVSSVKEVSKKEAIPSQNINFSSSHKFSFEKTNQNQNQQNQQRKADGISNNKNFIDKKPEINKQEIKTQQVSKNISYVSPIIKPRNYFDD